MTTTGSTPTTQRTITIRVYSEDPDDRFPSRFPSAMRAEAMAIACGLPLDTVLAIAERAAAAVV